MQVNDAKPLLSLGFFLGNNDALSGQVNVSRLAVAGFLRPAAGMPPEDKKIAKWISFIDLAEQNREVVGSHWVIAPLRLGLLDLPDWIHSEVAQLVRPVERTLDCDDGSAAIRGRPIRLLVDLLDNVERTNLAGGHLSLIAEMIEESLKVIAVPLEGAWFSVLFAPFKVLAEQLDDGQGTGSSGGWPSSCATLDHDLMVALKRDGLGCRVLRAIGKLDLLLAKLEIPTSACAKKGLGVNAMNLRRKDLHSFGLRQTTGFPIRRGPSVPLRKPACFPAISISPALSE